jgi:hypothetical protein
MLMLYRLEGELYGKPPVEELVNETAVGVVPVFQRQRCPDARSPGAVPDVARLFSYPR